MSASFLSGRFCCKAKLRPPTNSRAEEELQSAFAQRFALLFVSEEVCWEVSSAKPNCEYGHSKNSSTSRQTRSGSMSRRPPPEHRRRSASALPKEGVRSDDRRESIELPLCRRSFSRVLAPISSLSTLFRTLSCSRFERCARSFMIMPHRFNPDANAVSIRRPQQNRVFDRGLLIPTDSYLLIAALPSRCFSSSFGRNLCIHSLLSSFPHQSCDSSCPVGSQPRRSLV
jgi:hypothetical protein